MTHETAATRKSTPSAAFEAPKNICDLLQAIGQAHIISSGTLLFRKGDLPRGVFVIVKGRVALSAGDDAGQITRVAGKGSLLGLPSTVCNQRYTLTAKAVTDSEVCHIGPAEFRETMVGNPVLGLAIVRILSEEVSALRRIAL